MLLQDLSTFASMPNTILLLHGAIGSSEQLKPLASILQEEGFDPKLFDFIGHGGREIPDSFSIDLFAMELLNWMDDNGFSHVNIFGYSMGGYVALYLARHYPERVGKIMTLASKLAWDVPTAEKEMKMLNPEKIAEKIPKFAQALGQRHAPQDWKLVLNRTAEMMKDMGENSPLREDDFRSIKHEVRMMVGDRDTMVSIEETVMVYRLLNNGSLSVLPVTPHPIEQISTTILQREIESFFNS